MSGMGASCWEYLVPYQADLQAALNDLRRQVFNSGEYISPVTWDLTAPESVEAMDEQEYYWEFMEDNGTHSIIDVLNIVPYDMGEQEPGTVCAFTDGEYKDYFGSTRPNRADWDRFRGDSLFYEYVAARWTGRAMVLWADDAPGEIAFWGYSGD
jgi:hypothetical protein